MAPKATLYPPSPKNVPPDLTTPSSDYRLRVTLVLLSLILFFFLYLGMLVGSLVITIWAIFYTSPGGSGVEILWKIFLIPVMMFLFLFLLKGLFKRSRKGKSLEVEITAHDEPRLFAFIEELCAETGAPFPNRVVLTPEVNAAVFYESSILSLVLPTPKNLLIGLGLMNMLNLSEFKSVLAHEFGHFAQSSMKLNVYTYTANRIIADIVYGRDAFDDFLSRMKRSDPRIAIFAGVFIGILWCLRMVLAGIFRVINFANASLSRQMEFHADLVAVSVCGSDAGMHALARIKFAEEALDQALRDLQAAGDHGLYTRNLFFHQSHAASHLRKVKKDPKLGEPPPIPDDPDITVEVFDPDDDGIPSMWASHPPNYDREQNAKHRYIRCPIDERSPWLLFEDAEMVCERVTWRFYRLACKVKREVVLADPEDVQTFIDEEHQETTYDPRYHGLYDGRFLYLEHVQKMKTRVKEQPWSAPMIAKAHARLYGNELKTWMEDHNGRLEEFRFLKDIEAGNPQYKGRDFEFRGRVYYETDARRLLKKVDRELEKDRDWLESLDRKGFLVHYQMAQQLGPKTLREFNERYDFQLAVQDMFGDLSDHHTRLEGVIDFLSGKRELTSGQLQEARAVLRRAHKVLKLVLRDARELVIPNLKNMDAGQTLGPFLLEKRLVYSLDYDENSITGEWINKLMQQMGEVLSRLRRIHFKSMGGLLTLQERISQKWLAHLASLPEVLAVEPGEEEEIDITVEEPTNSTEAAAARRIAEEMELLPVDEEEAAGVETYTVEPLQATPRQRSRADEPAGGGGDPWGPR